MNRQLSFIITKDYNSYADALNDSVDKSIITFPEVSLVAEYIINEITHSVNLLRKDIECGITEKIDVYIQIDGVLELRDIVSPNFLLVKKDFGSTSISTAIDYIKKECNLNSLVIELLQIVYYGENVVYDPKFVLDLNYTEYKKETYKIGNTEKEATCHYFYKKPE